MAGVEDYLPGPLRSYFYGNAPADSPLSYNALQTRRKIAEQLMGRRSPFPKTIGEGLTYVGEAIGDRMQLADLDRREQAQDARDRAFGTGGPTQPPISIREAAESGVTPSAVQAAGTPTAVGGGPVAITPEPGTGREPFTFTAADVNPMDAAAIARPPAAPSTYRQAAVRPDPARSEAVAESPLIGSLEGGAMKDVPPDMMSPSMLGGEVPRGNAGLQPIISAREFERRDVVNPATGARVIAGQMSPSMGRAYGALPTEAGPGRLREIAQAGGAATPATATAQAPSEMFSPVPTTQAAPTVLSEVRKAPAAPLPSQEPIPEAAKSLIHPHPGAEPLRPDIPQPTARMQYLLGGIRNPYLSPERKAEAKDEYDRIAAQLKQQYEARVDDYKNKLTQYQHRLTKHEESVVNLPKAEQEERLRRLSIQKEIAERNNDPLTAEKLRLEIETARLAQIKTRQEIGKPEGIDVGGGRLERDVSPEGVRGPYAVPPGAPAPEVKYTEQQAKAAEFVNRVTPDLRRLEQLGNGKVLAVSPFSAAGSRLPGVGNVAMTDDYRQAMNAQLNWGAAFLTHVSGAAVSTSEASRNLPAFLVQLGDNDRDIAEKAERRRIYTEAIGKATGSAGRELIDKANADYLTAQAEKAKEPVRISSPDEARSLPPGRRLILPDGSVGQVPVRIRP